MRDERRRGGEWVGGVRERCEMCEVRWEQLMSEHITAHHKSSNNNDNNDNNNNNNTTPQHRTACHSYCHPIPHRPTYLLIPGAHRHPNTDAAAKHSPTLASLGKNPLSTY